MRKAGRYHKELHGLTVPSASYGKWGVPYTIDIWDVGYMYLDRDGETYQFTLTNVNPHEEKCKVTFKGLGEFQILKRRSLKVGGQ